jgi:hypothetical protein
MRKATVFIEMLLDKEAKQMYTSRTEKEGSAPHTGR